MLNCLDQFDFSFCKQHIFHSVNEIPISHFLSFFPFKTRRAIENKFRVRYCDPVRAGLHRSKVVLMISYDKLWYRYVFFIRNSMSKSPFGLARLPSAQAQSRIRLGLGRSLALTKDRHRAFLQEYKIQIQKVQKTNICTRPVVHH